MSLEITSAIPEDARRVLALTAQDLREAHLSEDEILAIADNSNNEHVETQRRRLELQPELYKVARLGFDVVGVIKTNEWFTGDQRPYASPLELAVLRKRDLFNSHRLKGNPLGIFALSTSNDAAINRYEIASQLLDTALEGQEEKEIRIGLRWNEPLRSLLAEEYKFQPTNKHGRQIGDVPSELYIRQPLTHSEQDQ
jgi:hypothetical protein